MHLLGHYMIIDNIMINILKNFLGIFRVFWLNFCVCQYSSKLQFFFFKIVINSQRFLSFYFATLSSTFKWKIMKILSAPLNELFYHLFAISIFLRIIDSLCSSSSDFFDFFFIYINFMLILSPPHQTTNKKGRRRNEKSNFVIIIHPTKI